MANGPGSFSGVSLSTAVQAVTIVALFAGNWYVMSERIENNNIAIKELKTLTISFDARLDVIEQNNATLAIRLENLREAVMELRRQSGLRTEMPR